MSFEKANLKMKFDTRMLEYNLAQGIITQEELDKHLASLPDESANTVAVTLDDSRVEEDDDIDDIDEDIDEANDVDEDIAEDIDDADEDADLDEDSEEIH